MNKVFIAVMLAGLFVGAENVFASTSAISGDAMEHSGRTDSSGCHNDTKQGTRHCH